MMEPFIVLILARDVDDLDQDVGDAAGDKKQQQSQDMFVFVFVEVKLT